MENNKYGQLMDQETQAAAPATTPEAPNKYAQMMDAEGPDQQSQLKQSMTVASEKDPDRYAKVMSMAQQMNLPASVVESNYDDLSKTQGRRGIDYASMTKNNPALSKWLETPDNAAISKDDLPNLAKIEDHVNDHSTMSQLGHALGSGFTSIAQQVAQTPALLYNVGQVAYHYGPFAPPTQFDKDGKAMLPTWNTPKALYKNPVTENLDSVQQYYQDHMPAAQESVVAAFGKGDWDKFTKSLLVQSVASAPQQVALIASMATGFGEAGLVTMGIGSAAQKNAQILEQNPDINPVVGTTNALLTGSAEAGFETIGTFGLLHKWEHALAKQWGKQTSKEVIYKYFKMLLATAAGEATEEATTSVAQDLTDKITGVQPDITYGQIAENAANAGVVGGFSGGVITSTAGAMSAHAHRAAVVNQMNEDKKFYLAVSDTAEGSKLRDRMPEAMKNYLEHVTKGTAVENIYVPTEQLETYFQSQNVNPVVAMQKIGALEAYNEAKATGSDVKIPLAQWVREAVGTEHYAAMADNIKFSPDGMTANEVKQTRSEMDELAANVETAKADEQKARAKSSKEVIQNVHQQLVEAGVNKSEAKQLAGLMAGFDNLGAQGQMQAQELFNKYGLNIDNGQVVSTAAPLSDEQILNQGPVPKRTVTFPVHKTDAGELTISPRDDISASASRYNGTTNIDKFDFNDKFMGTAQDVIRSLEKYAVAGGDTHMTAEIPAKDAKLVKAYEAQGFTSFKNPDGSFTVSKKLEQVTKLNQSSVPPAKIAPPFYSRLQQTIEQKMGTSAAPADIKGMIKEMKPEEIKWSGIDQFLKGKAKVNKAELLDFLRANQIEIKEVVKGNQGQAVEEGENVYGVFSEDDEWMGSYLHEANAENEIRNLRAEGHQAYSQIMEWDGETTLEDVEASTPGGLTKFSKYTLPGGENYREILFTLPEVQPPPLDENNLPDGHWLQHDQTPSDDSFAWKIRDQQGRIAGFGATKEAALADFQRVTLKENGPNFTSSHFEEPNILAHMRLDDRVDSDGKKVLLAEEIQSDWHQAGNKKGYRGEVDRDALTKNRADIVKEYNEIRIEHQNEKFTDPDLGDLTVGDVPIGDATRRGHAKYLPERMQELVRQYDQTWRKEHSAATAPPDAPLRKNWHEFALKRLIRMAAEGGYDKVAWTTGEQQNARYDLSKQVHTVSYEYDKKTNRYAITGKDLRGAWNSIGVFDEANLDEVIGKDLAEKIIKHHEAGNEKGDFSGEQLKIEGKGLKDLYDKKYVDFMSKFGKKFNVNAKVSQSEIVTGERELTSEEKKLSQGSADLKGLTFDDFHINKEESDSGRTVYDTGKGMLPRIIVTHYNNDRASLQTKNQANINAATLEQLKQAVFGKAADRTIHAKVHSLEITPELKDAALNQGFTLFQPGDEGPRGQISFGAGRSFNISLLKGADRSTFIHELGHLYLEVLGDVAAMDTASEQVKGDHQAILEWLGVESRDQIKVEHHEKFARGFEAYLMEGKAPSAKLRKAFAAFKLWLTDVYKQIKALNVELTPEVRGVFDRILASEDEINSASETFVSLIDDPTAEIMGSKAEAYINAKNEATQFAKDKLERQLLRDFQRTEKAFYKEKEKGVREEVRKELADTREHKALSILQDGVMPDGSPLPEGMPEIKISKSSLKDMGAENVPRGISTKDGMHVELAAQLLNYASGEDLMKAITGLPSLKEAVEVETKKKMAEYYPDSLTDGTISQSAIEAMHNDKRAEQLLLESKFLADHHPAVDKEVKRRVVRRVPTKEVVRAQAHEIIAGKKLSDIRPYIYLLAEKKAAKTAGELFAKGDIDGAFEAKTKERLNNELYRAATEAQADQDKQLKNWKRLFKKDEDIAKTRDVDIVNAARAVLAVHGITKSEKTAVEYLAKMKQYDPDHYETVKSLIDSAMENAGPLMQMKYNDFVSMKEAVNALWSLAKTSREIEIDGKKLDREKVKAELMAQALKFQDAGNQKEYNETASKMDKTKMVLLGAQAAATRVEHWADAMDIEKGGVFTRYIWRPISNAVTKYRLEKEPVIKQYRSILEEYAKHMTSDKINAPEIGFRFKNKAELLMALLHSGNESNLRKLVVGRGWGTVDENNEFDRSRFDAMIGRMQKDGTLTKADYDVVQKVWDLMETLKPGAQKAHKQMYGFYFNEITANEIQTPFGTYRGGYIPAKLDIYESEDANIRQERESFEKNNNSYMYPTAGRGFTKSRVETYAGPLTLDMNMLGGHIDQVLRFTHIEPRVKEVARIVMDKEFRAALKLVDPTIAKDALVPWLQRAAQQQVINPATNGLGRLTDAVAGFLRTGAAMQLMFGNVANAAQQFTGVFVAASKVAPKHLRNAVVTYINSPKITVANIMDRSAWMRSTQGSNIYESAEAIKKIIVDPSVFDNMRSFSKAHMYFLQSATQNIVNSVVWTGAYNEAIAGGVAEAEAVQNADAAVRMTQGTSSPEDISRFETGTQTARLFTMFTGYFNMLANLNKGELTKIARTTGLKKGAGKAFYVYMTTLMLSSVVAGAIVKAMGSGFDPDDDGYLDDALSLFFGEQFKALTAMVPYAGQLANATVNKFNDNMYDDRVSMSPVVSIIEGLAGTPKEVYDNIVNDVDNKKHLTKDILTLIGLMSTLPSGPIGRPVGYLMDVESGRAQPTGPVDFTRGLITGNPGSKH